MNNEKLYIVKIGGNVVDDAEKLQKFLADFASIKDKKILVHGGGKIATQLAEKLGIEVNMVNGRRITDAKTLDVTLMVYAGLANKNIVAKLQALHCNAIGLSGADASIITAHKRANAEIDYGFVGDIDQVNTTILQNLINSGFTPVMAPITHNGKGQLLNTNADTIAAKLATSFANTYQVQLVYCFEKYGVLRNVEDRTSVIPRIDEKYRVELEAKGIIAKGMLPKINNAFEAINNGVNTVVIGHSKSVLDLINPDTNAGTTISK
jgi:acetylglutamate kinase